MDLGLIFAVGIPLAILAMMFAGGMAKKKADKDAAEAKTAADNRKAAADAAEVTETTRKAEEAKAKREHELKVLEAEHKLENERRAFELEHEKVVVGNAEVTEAKVVQIGAYRSLDVRKVPAAISANQLKSIELCKETALGSNGSLTTGRGAEHRYADAAVEAAKANGNTGLYEAIARQAEARAREERHPVVIVRKEADEKPPAPDPKAALEAALKERDEAKKAADEARKELEAAKAKAKEGEKKDPPKDRGEKEGDKGKGGGGGHQGKAT